MIIRAASGHDILADDADAPLLDQFGWYTVKGHGGRRYAHARLPASEGGGRVLMHRLLMQPGDGMVVHHKNNDGLDNRRSNLEITTQRQNTRYAYDGSARVHLHKQTGKWRAQVRDEAGKRVSLGLFLSRDEAIDAVAARSPLRHSAGGGG
jgi:hypothetical protein